MRPWFRLSYIFTTILLLFSETSFAQGSQSKRINTSYTFEVTPFFGQNLPYDIWGTPGGLYTAGIRGAVNISNDLAIEAGGFYQVAGQDHATTGDLVFRYEIFADAIDAFFVLGAHLSNFYLQLDRDVNGACVPANCQTDTGRHQGFVVGGGIMIPITSQLPLKMSMRFYKNPILWFLFDVGVGIRF